jgi:decaprenyl-phosphate phosphoribosyltransferase
MRPRQWVKNLLVFAAPAAAGVLDQRAQAINTVVAFASFCLAASATYLWNDVADREADALHPRKRHRPVAAGALSPTRATLAGAVLLVTGLALSLTASWQLTVTIALYVGLTISYSLVLKHVAVIDLVVVAAGFVLRAIGGAAATGVPISNWFFIVTSFGSLFVVSGKRSGEATDLAGLAGDVRSTLSAYPASFLRQIRAVSSAVMLVAYCLWAFEQAAAVAIRIPLYELSIVPFTIAVLRYELLLEGGGGAAPEDLFFEDRGLQLAMAVWAVTFAAALAAG